MKTPHKLPPQINSVLRGAYSMKGPLTPVIKKYIFPIMTEVFQSVFHIRQLGTRKNIRFLINGRKTQACLRFSLEEV